MCGGAANVTCASTSQFCEMAIAACETTNPTGVCTTKPTNCDLTFAPVCGCDGKSYTNDCQRQAAGISKWYTGLCSASTCPAAAPTQGNSCSQGNITCVYSITTGPNAGCVERFNCSSGSWLAPVIVCPS